MISLPTAIMSFCINNDNLISKKVNAEHWINKLDLKKHPEGGYYRETYRSKDIIKNDGLTSRNIESRNSCTAIYYLLSGQEFSAFHRLKSDEIFHFYSGSSLRVHVINKNGEYNLINLGQNSVKNDTFQLIINQGDWFASEVSEPNSYSLIGCTVSPGFDFHDFELGSRDKLIKLYPNHRDIITKMTYN